MVMNVTAQFDGEQADKLAYIQSQTNEEVGEILNRAIDLYYRQLQPPTKSPLDIFEDVGLVGCIDADPNLSSRYESHVQDYLQQKHDQDRL